MSQVQEMHPAFADKACAACGQQAVHLITDVIEMAPIKRHGQWYSTHAPAGEPIGLCRAHYRPSVITPFFKTEDEFAAWKASRGEDGEAK